MVTTILRQSQKFLGSYDHPSLVTSKTGRLGNRGYIILYIPAHRYFWENHHNACLLPWAQVHHINHIKTDNRIENLQAMTIRQHTTLHNNGSRHSEETKSMIGLKSKGRLHSDEDKRKIAEASRIQWQTRDRHISEEQKEAVRRYRTGRTMPEEIKKKIAESVRRTRQEKKAMG